MGTCVQAHVDVRTRALTICIPAAAKSGIHHTIRSIAEPLAKRNDRDRVSVGKPRLSSGERRKATTQLPVSNRGDDEYSLYGNEPLPPLLLFWILIISLGMHNLERCRFPSCLPRQHTSLLVRSNEGQQDHCRIARLGIATDLTGGISTASMFVGKWGLGNLLYRSRDTPEPEKYPLLPYSQYTHQLALAGGEGCVSDLHIPHAVKVGYTSRVKGAP